MAERAILIISKYYEENTFYSCKGMTNLTDEKPINPRDITLDEKTQEKEYFTLNWNLFEIPVIIELTFLELTNVQFLLNAFLKLRFSQKDEKKKFSKLEAGEVYHFKIIIDLLESLRKKIILYQKKGKNKKIKLSLSGIQLLAVGHILFDLNVNDAASLSTRAKFHQKVLNYESFINLESE